MISYLPSFVPNKIMIVGCGGTGSRLVPLLGQFLKTCAWIINPEILLIDDDIVEEKNLLRQNFISPDVGKYKAEVLAQRYSRAFNVTMIPKVGRVTPYKYNFLCDHPDAKGEEHNKLREAESDWNETFKRFATNSIIVMCVDSPEARRAILSRVLGNGANGNILLIDSGNENDFGQISISTLRTVNLGYSGLDILSRMDTIPGDLQIPCIPMDVEYYQNMKAETTLSCADLDQTMAINGAMAMTMFGVIQSFYYCKPINFHRINVTLTHGSTPEYMNQKFLLRVKNHVYLAKGVFAKDTELSTARANLEPAISKFYNDVYYPFKSQVDDAKRVQADAEVAAQAKRDKELVDKQIKLLMRQHGWKYPDEEKKEAVTQVAQAISAVAKDKNEDIFTMLEATVAGMEPPKPKKTVKRTVKAALSNYEAEEQLARDYGVNATSATW